MRGSSATSSGAAALSGRLQACGTALLEPDRGRGIFAGRDAAGEPPGGLTAGAAGEAPGAACRALCGIVGEDVGGLSAGAPSVQRRPAMPLELRMRSTIISSLPESLDGRGWPTERVRRRGTGVVDWERERSRFRSGGDRTGSSSACPALRAAGTDCRRRPGRGTFASGSDTRISDLRRGLPGPGAAGPGGAYSGEAGNGGNIFSPTSGPGSTGCGSPAAPVWGG